jgi:hypothetical protein
MTTMEIGKKYVELCKAQKNAVALETLFSKDAVSVEAAAPPNGGAIESRGIDALLAKSKGWVAAHEVHALDVQGPWPNGNRFIVRFTYDITNKPTNRRIRHDETALFTVENDKIVREEFFYSLEG